MNLSPFMGEVIHGQKYEIGEFYKPHTDYWDECELNTYCSLMGQKNLDNYVISK